MPPIIVQTFTQQGEPIPQPVIGAALVDTGASLTCVHEPILQGLGLNPIGVVQAGPRPGLRNKAYTQCD